MDEMLRVSDHDREAVVRILQKNYAEGRLDQDELEARTRAALAAKRLGELKALTGDLPPEPVPVLRAEPALPPQQRSVLTWLGITAAVVLVAVIVLTVGLFENLSHVVANIAHDVSHLFGSVIRIVPHAHIRL